MVARVRRQLRDYFGHKVKVGHTGTLDPFATGLLILLSGKNTKQSAKFLKLDKVYEATLKLGYTSTTGDPEGKITSYHSGSRDNTANSSDSIHSTSPADSASITSTNLADTTPVPSLSTIQSTLRQFLGDQLQTVPKFSAVNIHGQRAYQLARQGQDFKTPTRTITVYQLEILSYHYPELKIRCHVSSGTYIRTLAEDIGKKLDTGAYLTSLRRTQIGDYRIVDAKSLPIGNS